MNAVNQFQGSVMMVSHDEHFLKKIANKLIIYDQDKVFNFNGTYKEFIKNLGWKDA
jgi:ATP-binding cassette subfamily F protein 3